MIVMALSPVVWLNGVKNNFDATKVKLMRKPTQCSIDTGKFVNLKQFPEKTAYTVYCLYKIYITNERPYMRKNTEIAVRVFP